MWKAKQMPKHCEIDPASSCQGIIGPRWRMVRKRWTKALGYKCRNCGLHWYKGYQGEWIKGMNLANERKTDE